MRATPPPPPPHEIIYEKLRQYHGGGVEFQMNILSEWIHEFMHFMYKRYKVEKM